MAAVTFPGSNIRLVCIILQVLVRFMPVMRVYLKIFFLLPERSSNHLLGNCVKPLSFLSR